MYPLSKRQLFSMKPNSQHNEVNELPCAGRGWGWGWGCRTVDLIQSKRLGKLLVSSYEAGHRGKLTRFSERVWSVVGAGAS
jgi:hypothetical protein